MSKYNAYVIPDTNKVVYIGEGIFVRDVQGSTDFIELEVDQLTFNTYLDNGLDYFIYDGEKLIKNPDYDAIVEQETRERLDSYSLTPSDIERALYADKGIDFEDLKVLIAEQMPELDMKAIGIEFRANNFYRGAKIGDLRLIDAVGQLLGYSTETLDYLFENGKFPEAEE